MPLSERLGSQRRISQGDDAVIRPGTIIITLVLMGISALFTGACAAYLYFVFSSTFVIPAPPLLFIVNIPVLIAATYYLNQARRQFSAKNFRRSLFACLILSVLFAILQLIGWLQFFSQVPFQASQIASLLFILSALHLLHVLAGLPFLISFLYRTRGEEAMNARPDRWWHDYLRGLARYWRFLDLLWILLVIVLWAGYGITALT